MWHPARLSAPVGNPVEPGQCLVAASTVPQELETSMWAERSAAGLSVPGTPMGRTPGVGVAQVPPPGLCDPPLRGGHGGPARLGYNARGRTQAVRR